MPFTAIDLVLCLVGLVAACPLALIAYALRASRTAPRAEVIDLGAARAARRAAEAPAAAARAS